MPNLPRHVAIIMDGNGRWAQNRGLHRIEGHRKGVETAEDMITYANSVGIEYLTLYAFSKENWNRPQEEVTALMSLLEHFLREKKQKMLDHGIRFNSIGDASSLPESVQAVMKDVREATSVGTKMVLTLALSYGARDEIIRAITSMMQDALANQIHVTDVNDALFSSYLDTKQIPDPDLIIRTSGEYRMSNFLLWQGAYAEYHFDDCLWPDFTSVNFDRAIAEYQKRERRYGKTSEQVN